MDGNQAHLPHPSSSSRPHWSTMSRCTTEPGSGSLSSQDTFPRNHYHSVGADPRMECICHPQMKSLFSDPALFSLRSFGWFMENKDHPCFGAYYLEMLWLVEDLVYSWLCLMWILLINWHLKNNHGSWTSVMQHCPFFFQYITMK